MESKALPGAAKKNVELISAIEQHLGQKRSALEQAGERVAQFFGSLAFIAVHALTLVVWVTLNSGLAGIVPFDPYPFALLSLIVGMEFILLTTFVLINQKLQSRRQDQWAHLNLQLCMLTEQEVTKNMQLLHSISIHLGLQQSAQDREISDLAKHTPVAALIEELDKG